MFVVLNFITVMWYNPNLDTDCPTWVYVSCALGLFLYQTFDAVDGMQAYVIVLLIEGPFTDSDWVLDGGRDRVDLLESFLITVRFAGSISISISCEWPWVADYLISRCRRMQHRTRRADLRIGDEPRPGLDDIHHIIRM
jgi:hypothetical protein